MKTKEHSITKNTRAVHLANGSVYTISMAHHADGPWASQIFAADHAWEASPATVMGKKIVPYGINNDIPTVIRKVMDQSNIGPGILERKIGLQYGEGPFIYRETIDPDSGQITRLPISHPEIQQWLATWDYERYVQIATTELVHTKGFYTRWYRNRAPRIGGRPSIARLEAVPGTWARLAWPEKPEKKLENVSLIYTGDFENNCAQSGITPYPVFDRHDPFRRPVAMSYHNIYSFARAFYSVPAYFGALKWLATASEIPDVIKYLTDNGISAAFHVHSPQGYWDDKRRKTEDRYPAETDAQIDRRIQELKDQLFQSIAQTLAGKQNAGKFIETVDFYDMDGNPCAWKIEPIDQKIKDFIEAQIKVSEKADVAATSGMGLNPALANLITGSSFSGGSQLLYAMKFHILTDINIPEKTIFQPINTAIAINWPQEDARMGFHRKIVMKEDEVTPQNRAAQQV